MASVNDLESIVGLLIRDKADQSVITVLRHGNITLGRAPDNDLRFDNPTISAHHARIYTYLTASYIEDLNSTNGTFVDGKRIQKHVLKPGNVIKLGTCEFVLEKPRSEELNIRSLKTIAT
jgi:pSer/pThr/pTyr-binding forkhead associated (FHA) protein